MFKFRDLTVIDVTPEHRLVIACDSAAGIGEKEMDLIKASPELTGRLTAQVGLMEVVAVGAKPISIINALGVEMEDTGKRIIEGIKEAIKPLNLDEEVVITGSTEENIPVVQTSMGITVVGLIEKKDWRCNKPIKGDYAVVVGIPKVGNEVLEAKENEIISLETILELSKKEYVKDILPVGSKGIAYELGIMSHTNDLEYEIFDNINLDLHRTAGLATCAIIAIDKDGFDNLKKTIPNPINLIATFI